MRACLRARTATLAVLASLALCATAQDKPTKPADLKAVADYGKVTLTWSRSASANTLLGEGFEGEAFPSEGWTTRVTNTTDQLCTWFHYPTDEFKEQVEDYADWIRTGERSACVYFDTTAPHDDGTPSTQDEWLITPAVPGAQYLDLYCYIDPEILNVGQFEEFGDHYYIKVSHDGGNTWENLWDARYDSDGSTGFQLVSLYLGNAAEGAPMVAFHAQSNTGDPDQSLYFAWVIDDISMTATPTDAAAARLAMQGKQRDAMLKGMPTHRTFDTTGLKPMKRQPRKAKAAPTASFNVYLDGTPIVEGLKTMTYTDISDKEPGEHTYAVTAVADDGQTESDPVEVKVNIKEGTTNPPANLRLTQAYDDLTGTYAVQMAWDEPDGERKPSYYTAYCNNALVGDFLEELSLEQTGLPRGVYDYSVVAVYEDPAGQSEAVGDQIALGTRYPARNLTATLNQDGSLTMAWQQPKASEHEVTGYAVYRGNDKLGEGNFLTFTEQQAPEGKYDYSVKAIYDDGVAAMPATQNVQNGDLPTYGLPFEESFTGGMKPGNWNVEKLRTGLKDNYVWRFDNLYELPVSGGGFDKDFASVNCSHAGYTTVTVELRTPPIARTEINSGEHTFLSFDMDYMTCDKLDDNYKSAAYVEYSVDNCASWEILDEPEGYAREGLPDGQTCQPVKKVYDVTDLFASGQPVYFAWSYNSRKAQHWAIDNVKIYNAMPSAITSATADNGNGKTEIYDLQGRRMPNNANLTNGIYIVKKNGKVAKRSFDK